MANHENFNFFFSKNFLIIQKIVLKIIPYFASSPCIDLILNFFSKYNCKHIVWLGLSKDSI